MITAPSDAWIESSHDPSVAFDDAGECDVCGFHLDSGRCECPEFRCAKCDCAMQVERETGCCSKCDLEFMAGRQLTFGERGDVNAKAKMLRVEKPLGSFNTDTRLSSVVAATIALSNVQAEGGASSNNLSGGSACSEHIPNGRPCDSAKSEHGLTHPSEINASPAQNLSGIRDLQDKLGAEAAGLVWALKQLDRYLK